VSVYKPTGTSTYYYRFQRANRTFQGSTQETNKSQAKAIERAEKLKAEQLVHAERAAGRRPMTVDRCFTFYADDVLKYRSTGKTSNRHLHWIEDQLGTNKLISELSNSDIAELVNARRECKRAAGRDDKGRALFKPVSVATVNRMLECLRAALHHVVRNRDAFVQPSLKIKRLVGEPKERTREASIEEEEAIFAALREDFHDIVRFALLTGIRKEGCLTLIWPNIDFGNRKITYLKKHKPGRDAETGTLPMTGEVETILRRQKGRHRVQVWTFVASGKKGGKGGSGRGGIYRKGERYPITYGNLQTRWRHTIANSGVSDFRFHDLRHTAATRMLRLTGNLKLVQTMLGHANIATTSKYAHVTNDDLRIAMERVQQAARTAREVKPLPENVVEVGKNRRE
jgi:integrase